MTERGVLRGNFAPHIPAAALADFGIELSRRVLVTDRGILHAAAVRDEHKVVFGEVDVLFLAVAQRVDTRCKLALFVTVKLDVCDLHAEVKLHAVAFKVLHHRQNHGLILVVLCKAQCLEIRQTADVMDKALNVQLHFECGVPVFKGEHRAPVEPEVGVQHLVVEYVRNALVLQVFVRREEQLHDLHSALIGNIKLTVRVGVFAAVHGRAAQGVVRVFFVKPVIFVQNGNALGLYGRNGTEQVPHDFKVVVHFTAAAHHVADVFKLPAVACTARELLFFEDVYMLAFHLAVAHQVARCCKGCQTAADDIRRFLVYALRLLRSCKCFIVAACIIHIKNLLKCFFRFCVYILACLFVRNNIQKSRRVQFLNTAANAYKFLSRTAF